MDVFEFILVVVAIIIGLGIAELLAGVVRILRGELLAGGLHSVWVLNVFFLQLQAAWALWGLRDRPEWQYPAFVLLLLVPVVLYLAAAVLFPGSGSSDKLDMYFIRRRTPFFLILAGYLLLGVLHGWFLYGVGWMGTSAFLIRLLVLAAYLILAVTENRRTHWLLGLSHIGLHAWWTYQFTFVIA